MERRSNKIIIEITIGIVLVLLISLMISYLNQLNEESDKEILRNFNALYEHPFTVSNSLKSIEKNILYLELDLIEYYKFGEKGEDFSSDPYLELIQAQVDTVDQRYLGSRKQVEELQFQLSELKALMKEYGPEKSGEFEEIKESLIGSLAPMKEFAAAKAEEILNGTIKVAIDDQSEINDLFNYLSIGVIIVSGVFVIIMSVKNRSIEAQRDQLIISLEEKTALLSEVHHRVKNNLAIVSALLELKKLDSDNDNTTNVINNSILRIKAMSLVHEMIYKEQDVTVIDISKLAKELYVQAQSHLGYSGDRISFGENVQDLIASFNLNLAIDFGLFITETVSSCIWLLTHREFSGDFTIDISIEEKLVTIKIFISQENEGDVLNDFLEPTLMTLFLTQLGAKVEENTNEVVRLSFAITEKKGSAQSLSF